MNLIRNLSAGTLIAGALLGACVLPRPSAAADVSIHIGVNAWSEPPPPLPVYDQPVIPGPGYLWTPGYWAISPAGYYWVPGAWVMPPYVGALWTPGYWAYVGTAYRWHPGYWGRRVGYYGGIDYGYGYVGTGYRGGYWKGRNFYYNRTVNRIDARRVTHVYSRKVAVAHPGPRASYHGGKGGIQRRPTPREAAAARERRAPPTRAQQEHARQAPGHGGPSAGPDRAARPPGGDRMQAGPGAGGRPDGARPSRRQSPPGQPGRNFGPPGQADGGAQQARSASRPGRDTAGQRPQAAQHRQNAMPGPRAARPDSRPAGRPVQAQREPRREMPRMERSGGGRNPGQGGQGNRGGGNGRQR